MRKTSVMAVIWCVGIGLTLAVLFLFDPLRFSFYPVCWLHKLTGLYCPGCGVLRASHHLLHGQVIAAFGCNPLFVVSLPVFAAWFVHRLSRVRRGGEQQVESGGHFLFWALVLVVLVFGVLRNLPYAAFAWMRP
jgi:Protein of unknown function (DUF2752)